MPYVTALQTALTVLEDRANEGVCVGGQLKVPVLEDKVNEGVCVGCQLKVSVLVVRRRYLCWWSKEGICVGGQI